MDFGHLSAEAFVTLSEIVHFLRYFIRHCCHANPKLLQIYCHCGKLLGFIAVICRDMKQYCTVCDMLCTVVQYSLRYLWHKTLRQNVFVQISKCICPNCKMYLSQLEKCICSDCKLCFSCSAFWDIGDILHWDLAKSAAKKFAVIALLNAVEQLNLNQFRSNNFMEKVQRKSS